MYFGIAVIKDRKQTSQANFFQEMEIMFLSSVCCDTETMFNSAGFSEIYGKLEALRSFTGAFKQP